MVDESLLEYVKDSLSSHVPLPVLRSTLRSAGWSDKEIDEALAQARSQQTGGQFGFGAEGLGTGPTNQSKPSLELTPFRSNILKLGGWATAGALLLMIVPYLLFPLGKLMGLDKTAFLVIASALAILYTIIFVIYAIALLTLGKVVKESKLFISGVLVLAYLAVLALALILEYFSSISNKSLVIFFGIGFFVWTCAEYLLAFGFLGASDKVRFEKATGIINLVIAILSTIALFVMVYLFYQLSNLEATLGSFTSQGGLGSSGGVGFSPPAFTPTMLTGLAVSDFSDDTGFAGSSGDFAGSSGGASGASSGFETPPMLNFKAMFESVAKVILAVATLLMLNSLIAGSKANSLLLEMLIFFEAAKG